MFMYYVYVLQHIESGGFYIGFTQNIERRFDEHQNKRGGRTTRIKSGWKLIYYETYLDKKDATGREKFLKGGSGRKYLNKQLKNYLESKTK